MSVSGQTVKCPVCGKPVAETAKYCSECGARLPAADAESAWIASMQERIRAAKENDIYYTVLAAIGVITAVAIPFVTRYILLYTMDTLAWVLTAVGIAFFIGSYIGMWYDERKVKRLIEQMEQGQRD